MEEIWALQKKLMEVQTAKPRKSLSERNTMEILDFLKREHSLDILCTLDGKEFLTPSALDQLIYEQTILTKKIRLPELESLLNVGFDWIESRIDSLVRNFGLIYINNQLITREFIELMFSEIEENLRTQKICSLTDIALRNEIDIAFLKSLVSDAKYHHLISTAFRLDARANMLISEQYYALMDRKLRGLLNGLTAPVKIDDIAEVIRVEKSLITERLAERDVPIESDMVFTKRFINNRTQNIEKLFMKNGVIEYNYLKRQFYIAKPKEFLQKMLKGTTEEKSIFLSKSVMSQTELIKIFIGCEQNLKAYGYVNIEDLVNFAIEGDDVNAIIELLHKELDPKGLDFESEDLLIVCKKDLKKYASLLEREVSEKKIDAKKATPKIVADLLTTHELIEYQMDDALKNFIAHQTLEVADLKKAAQSQSTGPKLMSRRFTKQVDLMKFKINEIIDRSSFIFKYYLLTEKYLRSIIDDANAETADAIRTSLKKIKSVVMQNIIFLVLRKFSHQFKEEHMNSFESFLGMDEMFMPLFQSDASYMGFFNALPADIRKVMAASLSANEAEELGKPELTPEEFVALDFDLVSLLNSKGTQLTIGNFDTNKNKKAEKAFISEAIDAFKTFCKQHLTSSDPELMFILIANVLALDEGMALMTVPDNQLFMDVVEGLATVQDFKFNELIDGINRLNTKFREALETKEDTEIFFEDLADRHLK
jgi:hypothetical protein